MRRSVIDYAALKVKQQAAWATGDYAQVGSAIVLMAELLLEAMDPRAGWRVLDVAGGSGNASLAAARRGCRVTSTDYVPALLERGKARAAAEGYRMEFMVADAEALPFAEGAFEAAVSTVGVMFAPDQERAAEEIYRVVKAGGAVGLACWTPESFVGRMFGVIAKYVPPPVGTWPPALWGTRERLAELFPAAAGIESKVRVYTFRARSAQHWLDEFKTYFGPMARTFAALDDAGQAGLTADLLGLVAALNRSDDGTMVWDSEYLEAVVRKG